MPKVGEFGLGSVPIGPRLITKAETRDKIPKKPSHFQGSEYLLLLARAKHTPPKRTNPTPSTNKM